MDAYNLMKECMSRKPISAETYSQKNRELIKNIQNGDNDAFTEFVLINGKLVINIMKQYLPNCMYKEYVDDMFQQGMLGLQRAASSYDCEASTAFSTYAYPWIRLYIFRYIAKNRLIHIPYSITEKFITVNKFIEKYKSENYGLIPDDDVICKETKVSYKTLQELYMLSENILSLDAVIRNSKYEDKDLIILDMVAAP